MRMLQEIRQKRRKPKLTQILGAFNPKLNPWQKVRQTLTFLYGKPKFMLRVEDNNEAILSLLARISYMNYFHV